MGAWTKQPSLDSTGVTTLPIHRILAIDEVAARSIGVDPLMKKGAGYLQSGRAVSCTAAGYQTETVNRDGECSVLKRFADGRGGGS